MSSKKQMSDDMRKKIVLKYETGKTAHEIAVELEINKKTVETVLMVFKKTGRINSIKKRAPKQKKITTNIKEYIKRLIEDDCSITLMKIKEKIRNNMNVLVSKSTIAKEIANFNYSIKKVVLVPYMRNVPDNIQSRYEYAINYLSLDENKVIFLDEFGVSCSMRVRHGRSPVGTPPKKTICSIRSKNYSVAAAITKKGLFGFKILNHAFNGELFHLFFTELIEKIKNEKMTGFTLIMDNCVIHKMPGVKKKALEENLNLLFLPPYSPQLNAIEEFFSKWKHNIKSRNSNTSEELQTAIHCGYLNINANDCDGYFRNVRKFALKAIKKENLE